MATKGKVRNELRKHKLIERDYDKRNGIKDELRVLYARVVGGEEEEVVFSDIERLQGKIDLMPRNGSRKRRRNRCKITGRPRGFYRKFGLCRNKIRELAMAGHLPGVVKSSW